MTATDEDWPWMEVPRGRLERVRVALADAGVEVSIETGPFLDPLDAQVERWWGGGGLLGYKRGDTHFLHPNYMEPEEKAGLTAPEGSIPSLRRMVDALRSSSGSQFIAMMKVMIRDFGGDSSRFFAALNDATQQDRVVAALNEAHAQARMIIDSIVLPEPGSPLFEELAAKYREDKA